MFKEDLDSEVDDGTFGSEDVATFANGEKVLVSRRSSHSVGLDGPWICAFHQVAALDSPFVLGYPFLIMSSLGWSWGSVAVVFFGVLSFYCNLCLASVHEHGGVRNIRYRDLMSNVVGKWTYYPTWILQYVNILAGNVGLVILSGQFIKAVHDQYSTNASIKLTEWIVISATMIALFTFIMPHLHHLRVFSGIGVALIFVFVGITVGIAIQDGDFIALIGSIAVFPFSIILPLVMTAIVNKEKWSGIRIKSHWIGSVLLTLVCIASTIASGRFIFVDAKNFHVFANVGQSG